MLDRLYVLVLVCCLGAVTGPAMANATNQDLLWDLRARSEVVDDDGYAASARAHTLRARLAFRWRPAERWQVLAEGEHIEALGNRYNSTANGAVRYPIIADPEATELNQLWIAWHGEAAEAHVGRQRITLENQRHVGNVGWRQNEQTYDAARVAWQANDRLTLDYVYLDRVHRIHSDRAIDPLHREREHDSHLLSASLAAGPQQRLVAYAYLLDDRDRAADSTATYGLRWTGGHALPGAEARWALEAARQHDHADNPGSFALWYTLVEPHLIWRGVDWKLGWERLSGNGSTGYATPLATLFAFNGWGDKFLATPADGLDDRYISIGGRHRDAGWSVTLHDYRAERGGASYGREIDIGFSFALPTRLPVTAAVRAVDYRERGFATDTRKYVVQLEWKGSRTWGARP